jgi:hypothetical protein
MNTAHLHLLLNHLPTIGLLIGIILLAAARLRRNDELTLTSLVVVFVIGVFTIPAYMSGSAAQRAIGDMPGVSADAMRRHLDGAMLGLAAMMVTSILAWAALWQGRRVARPSGAMGWAVLAGGLVTLALMANAAAMGGAIRHPELAADAAAAVDLAPGLGARVAQLVVEQSWVWPALETLHFIGLALLAGVLLPVNLRLLGLMRAVPYTALHALLPWAIGGFTLNTVSGMCFFITSPDQYTANAAFAWKMLFILLAGLNLLYLTVVDDVWAVGAGERAPARVRAMAASALALWFGVIFWGRLMPFLTL